MLDQPADIMESVTRMLDEGKNVDIIYLDFAKVPHHTDRQGGLYGSRR